MKHSEWLSHYYTKGIISAMTQEANDMLERILTKTTMEERDRQASLTLGFKSAINFILQFKIEETKGGESDG